MSLGIEGYVLNLRHIFLSNTMREIRRNLSLLAISCATLLIIFAIIETTARYTMPPDINERWQTEREAVDTYSHYIFTTCDINQMQIPFSGKKNIVVVGESSGSHVAEHMHRMAPKNEATIHNCAIPGAALEDVERLALEALESNPDELVIVFGHNLSFLHPQDKFKFRLQYWRSRSAALSWIVYSQNRHISHPARNYAALSNTPNPDDESVNCNPTIQPCEDSSARIKLLEITMRRIAHEAKRRNVGVTLLTMAANHWWPPNDPHDVRRQPDLMAVRLLRAVGSAEETLDTLKKGAKTNPKSATWQFELATELAHHGDFKQAAQRFAAALRMDDHQNRATSAVNQTIRRIVSEEGLKIRDTALWYQEHAPNKITGWEAVADNCHLLAQGYVNEAQAVLRILGFTPSSDTKNTQENYESIADVIIRKAKVMDDPRYKDGPIDNAVTTLVWRSLLDRPKETHQEVRELLSLKKTWSSKTHSRLLAAIADGYARAGQVNRAAEFASMALTMKNHVAALVTGSLVLLSAGQTSKAIQALKTAVHLEPTRPEADILLDFIQ